MIREAFLGDVRFGGAHPATPPRNAAINWHREKPAMSLYQRFESLVAIVLTLLTAVIIVVALYRLTRRRAHPVPSAG